MGPVTQLHPRPTESISACDGSARRHISDSYSASFTCTLSPQPAPPSLPPILRL